MFREKVPKVKLDKDDRLTRNFQLKEFCVSDKFPSLVEGLYLTVDQATESLIYLCHFLLQPIRDKFDTSIIISSGYRNRALNTANDSGDYSMHLRGKAADIYTDDITLLADIFDWVIKEKSGLFGELLLYKKKNKDIRFMHIALPEWGRGVKIDDEVIKNG